MLDKLFHKYITSKNMIFTVAVVVFLLLISKMQDIAIMFFASFVLACSLNPIVDKLAKKYNRSAASAMVLFGALFIVALFIVPMIILAGNEIKTFAISFPEYIDRIKDFIQSSAIIKKYDFATVDIGGVISSASGFTSNVLNEVVSLGKNLGSAFVYLLASLIIIYYFLSDKTEMLEAYKRFFPVPMRDRAEEVLEIISKKIGGYVVGQVAAMASVGIIMTIGLAILKVDYAVLLGLITAILDIIPIIGPGVALIVCLIAAYEAGPVILALIIVVFAVAQIAENNLVKPYVFGKLLDLHPVIIYLFLFITAKYLGVIGVIFAPAIAATICVLIQELYIKNLEE